MKRIYYGWVVCLMSTLLLFVTMGTVSNGFSIYLPYIMSEHGLTHAQTSSLVTLRCLVSFFAMLGIGLYYKRFSIRVGVGIAAACAGVSFFVYGLARSYGLFCLGAAISGLSYGLGSMIPVSILMNRWFVSHRALALSVCASGSGIATIVLPPVTTALIKKFSMAATFRMESVFIFVLLAVIVFFLRSDPADKGLAPYGQAETVRSQAGPGPSFTLTKRAWVLMTCVSLFMGALANPGFSHLSVLYSSEGFSPAVVALLVSGTGLMITVGKLCYGQTTDRIGGERSSLLFGGIMLGGYLLCCLAFLQSVPLAVVNVLCVGMGYPIATMGPSVWANDMASPDRYPTVIRRLQVIYAGGALLFANVPGWLADAFGGYIPAYLVFSALLGAALVLIRLAYRETARQRSHST